MQPVELSKTFQRLFNMKSRIPFWHRGLDLLSSKCATPLSLRVPICSIHSSGTKSQSMHCPGRFQQSCGPCPWGKQKAKQQFWTLIPILLGDAMLGLPFFDHLWILVWIFEQAPFGRNSGFPDDDVGMPILWRHTTPSGHRWFRSWWSWWAFGCCHHQVLVREGFGSQVEG